MICHFALWFASFITSGNEQQHHTSPCCHQSIIVHISHMIIAFYHPQHHSLHQLMVHHSADVTELFIFLCCVSDGLVTDFVFPAHCHCTSITSRLEYQKVSHVCCSHRPTLSCTLYTWKHRNQHISRCLGDELATASETLRLFDKLS